MRFLLLGINYAPEIISTAVYSTGLAEWLAQRGHDTHVVTAKPYFPAWRVFDGWGGWYRTETPQKNLRVMHCPLYVPRRPTGVKRILHHASFALMALPVTLFAALRHKPDIVFVVAPSIMAAPVGKTRFKQQELHDRQLLELYQNAKRLYKKLRCFDYIRYTLHEVKDLRADITKICELLKTSRLDQFDSISKSEFNFYLRLIVESSIFLDAFNNPAEAIECRKLIPCHFLREKVFTLAEVYRLSPPV